MAFIYNTRTPSHPGEVLRVEFLDKYEITPSELADHIDCPVFLIEGLVRCKQRMTAELAAMVAAAFDTSVDFWTNLQAKVDEYEAQNVSTTGIKPIVDVPIDDDDNTLDFAVDQEKIDDLLDTLKQTQPKTPDPFSWPDPNQDQDEHNTQPWDQYKATCKTDPIVLIENAGIETKTSSESVGFSAYQTIGIGAWRDDKTDA